VKAFWLYHLILEDGRALKAEGVKQRASKGQTHLLYFFSNINPFRRAEHP
jgi:hypothetical protein